MVFFVLGDYDFAIVKNTVEKYAPKMALSILAKAKSETIRKWKSKQNGRFIIEDRGTHQAHVMIGCAAYGSKDDRRIALYFLNNLLGGPGMNSRLNIALRERRGLVYTVESSLTNYTDTSTWAIYFGCDYEDVDKCCRLVRKELDRLMSAPLSKAQFLAAMKQIKGQIGVACDNSENYILDTAKAFLHYNRFEGIEDTFQHLDKLTPEFLQQVAQDIFNPEKLTTLIFK
jgi:predicted Zn-dependent peptidase